MAADLSDARANIILDALPTQYLAPSSTLPNLDGTNVTEPVAGDYVRPAITLAAAAARAKTSSAVADFISGGGVAASSAGTFQYWATFTAASAGTMIWRGTFTTPLAWVVGQQVEIAAGDITFSFPNT
jgi:hypothetical protein